MDPASTTLKLIAALLLIGINAFFVAAEQSLTVARATRLEPLAKAGDRRAGRILAFLAAPTDLRATAQLGAALATLGVGLLAFSAVYGQIRPRLDPVYAVEPTAGHLAGVVVALLLLALLHVVVGTQLPRAAALRQPEQTAAWTLPLLKVLSFVAWPLLRLMRAFGRLFGATDVAAPPLPHTAEELRLLVEQGGEGAVEDEQEQMLLGVIQFNDTLAREVMTPRRDIIALPVTATREETLALAAEEGHSRIPVYHESIDDVIGILLVKDLLTQVISQPAGETFDLRTLVREAYFVPDTKRIGELLPELRTRSVHMAIVLDEFGGTDGLVTLEDMLEEIVGDIYDEHDVPEEEEDFAITESGEILIDGSASIFDVNEKFGLALPEKDYDTIGGFVFGELGRVPVPGDTVPLNGAGELCVDEVEERRVTRVRLIPAEPAGHPPEGGPAA